MSLGLVLCRWNDWNQAATCAVQGWAYDCAVGACGSHGSSGLAILRHVRNVEVTAQGFDTKG